MSPDDGNKKFVYVGLTAGCRPYTSSLPEDGGGNFELPDADPEPAERVLSYQQLQKLTRAEQVEYARNRNRRRKP